MDNELDQPQQKHLPIWALVALIVTAIAHLILQRDSPSLLFMVSASLFWCSVIIYLLIFQRNTLIELGFRLPGLWPCLVASATTLVALGTGLFVFAVVNNQLSFPATTPILLLAYPVYGLVQQFLVLGILWNRLDSSSRNPQLRILLAVLIAALFGAIHWPNLPIIVGTAILECLMIAFYVRWRNLWPLGFLHGWSGVFYYLWYEGRDMWQENVGRLFDFI